MQVAPSLHCEDGFIEIEFKFAAPTIEEWAELPFKHRIVQEDKKEYFKTNVLILRYPMPPLIQPNLVSSSNTENFYIIIFPKLHNTIIHLPSSNKQKPTQNQLQ
eukprot:GEZU01022353.1.p2 GENE.GEZU01022353.1~~GEZU01022353.1.p2  ORF type:complete len:104 (+),score=16.50 GEZU01022353.1:866-1177(+)